jgi:hypothetical protein
MMTRREANKGVLSMAAAAMMAPGAAAAELMQLPPPRKTGGKPLIDALQLRHSTREFSEQALPPQVLSDLLWAGFGINRPATGDGRLPEKLTPLVSLPTDIWVEQEAQNASKWACSALRT